MAAIGTGRVLRTWNPATREEEKINLASLAPEKRRLINGPRETAFPNDDGRVFLLRQTDDGGCTKAGYIQMGTDGNPMTLLPSQNGQWWAMVSTPASNGSVGYRRVRVALGKFGPTGKTDDAGQAVWGIFTPNKATKSQGSLKTQAMVSGVTPAVMAISLTIGGWFAAIARALMHGRFRLGQFCQILDRAEQLTQRPDWNSHLMVNG